MVGVKELKVQAKELKIPKYYKMKKSELIEAINLALFNLPKQDIFGLILFTPVGQVNITYDTIQEAMNMAIKCRNEYPQYLYAEITKNNELIKRISLKPP